MESYSVVCRACGEPAMENEIEGYCTVCDAHWIIDLEAYEKMVLERINDGTEDYYV